MSTTTAKNPAATPWPETADIETSSDDYARRFAGAVGAWMLAVQERITVGILQTTRSAAVLNVGGGHGQLAIPLCERGYPVTVIGSDESCRNRISAIVESGQCRFVTGNVIALPFADQSFDTTISFRLLPHCVAWPTLIAELCRVARRSVIVDYPTSRSVNALAPALFGAKKKLEGNTREWRLFQDAEVASAFEACGFKVRRRRPQFFLPMALHRMLKCRPLSAGLEAVCRAAGLTRLWGSPVILEALREAR